MAKGWISFLKIKRQKLKSSGYCLECIFISYIARKPKVVIIMTAVMIAILNTFF